MYILATLREDGDYEPIVALNKPDALIEDEKTFEHLASTTKFNLEFILGEKVYVIAHQVMPDYIDGDKLEPYFPIQDGLVFKEPEPDATL